MKKYPIILLLFFYSIFAKSEDLKDFLRAISYDVNYSHFDKENANKYSVDIGFNLEVDKNSNTYLRFLDLKPGGFYYKGNSKYFLDFTLFDTKIQKTIPIYYNDLDYVYEDKNPKIYLGYKNIGFKILEMQNFNFFEKELNLANIYTGFNLNCNLYDSSLFISSNFNPEFGLSGIQFGEYFNGIKNNNTFNIGIENKLNAHLAISLFEALNFDFNYSLNTFVSSNNTLLWHTFDSEINFYIFKKRIYEFYNPKENKKRESKDYRGLIFYLKYTNFIFGDKNINNKISFGIKYTYKGTKNHLHRENYLISE